MDLKELLPIMEEQFPQAIITKRGKRLIVNDGSFHNDMPLFDMSTGSCLYDCGIHVDLQQFAETHHLVAEFSDKNEIVLTQE